MAGWCSYVCLWIPFNSSSSSCWVRHKASNVPIHLSTGVDDKRTSDRSWPTYQVNMCRLNVYKLIQLRINGFAFEMKKKKKNITREEKQHSSHHSAQLRLILYYLFLVFITSRRSFLLAAKICFSFSYFLLFIVFGHFSRRTLFNHVGAYSKHTCYTQSEEWDIWKLNENPNAIEISYEFSL